MAKYLVKVGTHREAKVSYTAGQVCESKHDLVAMYGADKFQLIELPAAQAPVEYEEDEEEPESPEPLAAAPAKGSAASKKAAAGKSAKQPAKPAKKAAAKKGAKRDLGRECTDDFPLAEEAGMLVYVNDAGEYSVVEQDEPTKPLNDDPMEAGDIDSYLKQFVPDEE